MPSEILSLQVGRCGNHVAAECWKQFCLEHGIEADGSRRATTSTTPATAHEDQNYKFFYEDEKNFFAPRAVLLDLEPRGIHSALATEFGRLHKRENIFYPNNIRGRDRGSSNFLQGYNQTEALCDSIFDIIDGELEHCDSPEGFLIYHSVAGGSGSGMGCHVIEQLAERHSKKFVQTCSIVPRQQGEENALAQSCNALLTFQCLAKYADCAMIFDNEALCRNAERKIKAHVPEMRQLNYLIANAMALATAPIRFPLLFNYSTLRKLTLSLIPHPSLNFLIPSYATLQACPHNRRHQLFDFMLQLSNAENSLVSCCSTHDSSNRFVSMMQILRGPIDSMEVFEAREALRKIVKLPSWCPAHFPVLHAPSSPHLQGINQRLSGLMLSNHTSMSKVLQSTLAKFEEVKNNRDFLSAYLREGNGNYDEDVLMASFSRTEAICKIYKEATKDDFIQWRKPGSSDKVTRNSQKTTTDEKLMDRLQYANKLLKKLPLKPKTTKGN